MQQYNPIPGASYAYIPKIHIHTYILSFADTHMKPRLPGRCTKSFENALYYSWRTPGRGGGLLVGSLSGRFSTQKNSLLLCIDVRTNSLSLCEDCYSSTLCVGSGLGTTPIWFEPRPWQQTTSPTTKKKKEEKKKIQSKKCFIPPSPPPTIHVVLLRWKQIMNTKKNKSLSGRSEQQVELASVCFLVFVEETYHLVRDKKKNGTKLKLRKTNKKLDTRVQVISVPYTSTKYGSEPAEVCVSCALQNNAVDDTGRRPPAAVRIIWFDDAVIGESIIQRVDEKNESPPTDRLS